jgi:putative inorganic carbon (hco3(-)) transporter
VLAVCLVPLVLPVGQVGIHGSPLELIKLACLAAIGLLWWRQLYLGGPLWTLSPMLLGAAAVVLAALLATVTAGVPGAALRLDTGYLLGLLLAVTVPAALPDAAALRLVMITTALAGGIACTYALFSAGPPQEHYGGTVVTDRATGMFGQPNELGSFAAIIAMLGLAGALALPRRHLLRWPLLAGVGAAVAALAVSLSRGGWIGGILGLVVLIALVRPATRRRILTGIATVGVAALAGLAAAPAGSTLGILRDRAASLFNGDKNPYDDRPAIWREARRMVSAHPLLGVGPGGYPHAAGAGLSELHAARPDHAHSLLLTIAAEQGSLGVAALGVTVLIAVAAVVGAARRLAAPAARAGRSVPAGRGAGEQELLAGTAAALATVLGQGLFDYPLRNPVLETLTWLLLGMLAAACTNAYRDAPVGIGDRLRAGAVARPGAAGALAPVPGAAPVPAGAPAPTAVPALPAATVSVELPGSTPATAFTAASAASAGLGVRLAWRRP